MKKNLRTFWGLIFVSILALMALKYSFNLSLYGLLVSLGWIIALITVVGILSLFAGWLIHFFKNEKQTLISWLSEYFLASRIEVIQI